MAWALRLATTTTMVMKISIVTAYGGNQLYHNNGNCTFTDVTDQGRRRRQRVVHFRGVG